MTAASPDQEDVKRPNGRRPAGDGATVAAPDSASMPPAPRHYWMVQWSGGGGFGHYAWLLSDALAGLGVDVRFATRRTAELADMPHRHRSVGVWADAPAGPPSRSRSARIAVDRLVGWLRLLRLVAWQRGSRGSRGTRGMRGGRDAVVHVQAADRLAELPFLLALRASGATLITTAHNVRPHDTGLAGRLTMQLLYRVPHGVITHTDEAADAIRALAGSDRRVLVVRHPSYLPMVDHYMSALPPTQEMPLTVAHLGSVRPYKGLDRVVAAVQQAQLADSGLRLAVVGRADDEAVVAGVVSPLRSGSVRTRLGYVSIAELVDEARAADVVMLGHRSTSESGIAHLALGAGAVVVGPRMAAIARLLASEESWLYDPEDPQDAGRALTAVLAEIAADRAGLRRRARAVAEAVPSWDDVAEETLQFVTGLRAHRHG